MIRKEDKIDMERNESKLVGYKQANDVTLNAHVANRN